MLDSKEGAPAQGSSTRRQSRTADIPVASKGPRETFILLVDVECGKPAEGQVASHFHGVVECARYATVRR